MRRERKVVWIHPNLKNPDQCTVMLVDKYVSLCPQDFHKKANFYLQSKQKVSPVCWYQREVLGENSIGKVIGNLMESAGYEGFFSGHSLRRTGGTRLFQAGVQRKLVKEVTGHTSDAIDKYQVTSDEQRATMSNIIQGHSIIKSDPSADVSKVSGEALKPDVCIKENQAAPPNVVSECNGCKNKKSEVGGLIEQIVSSVNANGKAKIKIEIEISTE